MTETMPTLTDPAVLRCPFEAYRKMRAAGPVYRDPVTGFFVVTRYEDARAVAADPQRFSNRTQMLAGARGHECSDEIERMVREQGWQAVPGIVDNDPPEHRKYRSVVDKAFGARRIKAIEGAIEATADALIDRFADDGEVELVSALAVPLPMFVIADQIGVPRSRSDDFKRWSDAVMERASPATTPRRQVELTRIIVEMQQFFAAQIATVREAPRDDVISDIATALIDDRALTMEEMQTLLLQVLVAGNETTTNAIATAMLCLVQEGLEERLRTEAALIPAFIEETLRLHAPLQNLFRRATCDTEIGGVPIPKDAILVLSWGASNRDERRFDAPDALCAERKNVGQHNTFGFGVHYCVGNLLARAELRIVYTRLLSRLRDFRIVGDAPQFVPHLIARGMPSLRVSFSRR